MKEEEKKKKKMKEEICHNFSYPLTILTMLCVVLNVI